MANRVPYVGDHVGRYLLTGVLGRGGMGTVFEARDTALERVVALKMINPAIAADADYRERFRREAIAMSQLDSAHVVTVHDHGEQDGAPYLVTQLVPGGDLDTEVRRGALSPQRALDLTGQVLDGLADAHAAGIVHRDIKPSNVLLSAGGDRAYLCDFGIATSPDAAITRTGTLMGSIPYMAPERHSGADATNAGPAGDIYAVGCLLWAMLTGTPPYIGTDVEVAMGHLHGAIPRLPGEDAFSAGINDLLARSLAKDPAQRYPTARAMRAAIGGLLAGAPAAVQLPDATAIRQPLTVVPAAPAGPPTAEKRRRIPAALLALVAVLGVILGVTGIVLAAQRPTMITALTGDAQPTESSATGAATATPTERPRASRPAAGSRQRQGSDDVALPAGDAGTGTGTGAGTGAGTSTRHHSSTGGGTSSTGGTGGSTHTSSSPQPRASTSPSPTPAPTTSSPPPPPPPAYTCWDGTPAATLSSCGYPTGTKGMQWMFPHRKVSCSYYATNTWRCHFDAGNNGEINRSSQHLEFGGVRGWPQRTGVGRPATHPRSFAGSGVLTGRCVRRCARPVGRTRPGWCSGSSGG